MALRESYRGTGQGLRGIGEMIPQKAFVGSNKDGVSNVLGAFLAMYGTYERIPAWARYKLFGDKQAFVEDKSSIGGGMLDDYGEWKYSPKEKDSETAEQETEEQQPQVESSVTPQENTSEDSKRDDWDTIETQTTIPVATKLEGGYRDVDVNAPMSDKQKRFMDLVSLEGDEGWQNGDETVRRRYSEWYDSPDFYSP